MIERETFAAFRDEPKPYGSVVASLNDWRREHRDAAILGVQWRENSRAVSCEVTFETPEGD